MEWEELLAYQQLTASYRAAPSLLDYVFTKLFYKNPQTVYGDTVEMITIAATNTPGPMNTKGSAARPIQPKGGAKRAFSIFDYFTELPIDPMALMHLQAMDSPQLQQNGQDVLNLQLEESATKQRLAKEVILASIMTYNRVNIDNEGNILVPSVHATTGAITDADGTLISADFGVLDAHRGNLGGTIGALWSVPGTDIASHLDAIDRKAAIAGVPKPMDFYVNGLHKSAFANNTQVKAWAPYANVNNIAGQVLNNFDGDTLAIFNKRFHFISGTWVDKTGTTQDIMPQNIALAVPDMGPWMRAFRGRRLVPNAVGIASAATPMSNFTPVEGEYAYAFTNHNPVRTSIFTGDTYGLGFANPDAIWVPKVF